MSIFGRKEGYKYESSEEIIPEGYSKPIYLVSRMLICNTCGVWVGDPDFHDGWHSHGGNGKSVSER